MNSRQDGRRGHSSPALLLKAHVRLQPSPRRRRLFRGPRLRLDTFRQGGTRSRVSSRFARRTANGKADSWRCALIGSRPEFPLSRRANNRILPRRCRLCAATVRGQFLQSAALPRRRPGQDLHIFLLLLIILAAAPHLSDTVCRSSSCRDLAASQNTPRTPRFNRLPSFTVP